MHTSRALAAVFVGLALVWALEWPGFSSGLSRWVVMLLSVAVIGVVCAVVRRCTSRDHGGV